MSECSEEGVKHLLEECEDRLDALREALTDNVDASSIGVKPKAPFLILTLREALAWRTEELGRNACDALRRHDLIVAVLLTRAVIENGALLWRLKELIESHEEQSLENLHQTIVSALAGWKSVPEFPKATNIMTHITRLARTFSDVSGVYDSLSEAAHPNWSGVFGAYGTFGPEEGTAHFGRNKSDTLSRACHYATALSGAMLTFEAAFNAVAELMPGFIDQLAAAGLGWDDP